MLEPARIDDPVAGIEPVWIGCAGDGAGFIPSGGDEGMAPGAGAAVPFGLFRPERRSMSDMR
jgi:hypothetical protein